MCVIVDEEEQPVLNGERLAGAVIRGAVMQYQMKLDEAEELLKSEIVTPYEAKAIGDIQDDEWTVAYAYFHLGVVAMKRHEHKQALIFFRTASNFSKIVFANDLQFQTKNAIDQCTRRINS